MPFRLALLLLLALALPPAATAQAPAVDLAAGTINGLPVCGTSMDELTDVLGRPSGVDDNEAVASIIGVQLLYHPLGLAFRFRPESEDPERGLWMTTIYLSREWDSNFNEHFIPFEGDFASGADANWKDDDVESAFADREITVRTAEEHEEQTRQLGVSRPGATYNHVLKVDFGDYYGNFQHERNTMFLERVTVECKSE